MDVSLDNPLLIYDGDCPICCQTVGRWQNRLKSKVDFAPFQGVADRFPGIPLARFKRSIQLVVPSGEIYEGAEAVFRVIEAGSGRRLWTGLYSRMPGFASAAEILYRLVSKNRAFFSYFFYGQSPCK